jgi:hypothetical protein
LSCFCFFFFLDFLKLFICAYNAWLSCF